MKELFVIAAAILFFVMLCCWQPWANSHSKTLIERWARENGCQLVRSEISSHRSAEFPNPMRGQVIWAVRVRNSRGEQRDAWLRCGGTALGYHLSEVEVRWTGTGRSAFV